MGWGLGRTLLDWAKARAAKGVRRRIEVRIVNGGLLGLLEICCGTGSDGLRD